MQKIVERFKNFNSRHRKFLPFIIYPEMVVIVFVSILGYLRRRLKIVIPVILVILLAIFFISRAVSSDRHVGDENTEITGVDVAEGNENQANGLDGASEAEGGDTNDSDTSSGTSTEKSEEVEQKDTEQPGNAEQEIAEKSGEIEQGTGEQSGSSDLKAEEPDSSSDSSKDTADLQEEAAQTNVEGDEAADGAAADNEAKGNVEAGNVAADSAAADNEAKGNVAEGNEAADSAAAGNEASDNVEAGNEAADSAVADNEATDSATAGNEAVDSAAADNEASDSGISGDSASSNDTKASESPDQETNSSETPSARAPIINPIIVSDSDINKVFEDYPESVAWIRFEDGLISYPVMQSEDNTKYTIKDYTGSDSDTGAIFMDYRSSDSFNDPNTIIYGHNMRDYSMFGAFKYYKNDLTFLKDHKYFQIITPEGTSRYMIFAYMNVPKDSDIYNMVGDSSDKMRGFLDKIEYRTFIDTGIEPTVEDKIITLSTCTQSDNLHFVMFAVKTTD